MTEESLINKVKEAVEIINANLTRLEEFKEIAKESGVFVHFSFVSNLDEKAREYYFEKGKIIVSASKVLL